MVHSYCQCSLCILCDALPRCRFGKSRAVCHRSRPDFDLAGLLTWPGSFRGRWCSPLGERPGLLRTLENAKRSQAAKDVAASQDILVDLFGRMESFFRRLEIYTAVALTSTMTIKMVEITVEVLDILATATKEIKQSRASELVLRYTLLKTHIRFRKVCEKGGGADGSRGWDEEAR
jgi:hypothetical protein